MTLKFSGFWFALISIQSSQVLVRLVSCHRCVQRALRVEALGILFAEYEITLDTLVCVNRECFQTC